MQNGLRLQDGVQRWEKDQSFSSGRLRARDTDFFHGTCKNARLRLDAEEAPAGGKVAELEAKSALRRRPSTSALEEKMAVSSEDARGFGAKFAALEAKLTAAQ